MYYLNYLGGAAAVFQEESLTNHFMLPGPGVHPVGLVLQDVDRSTRVALES